MKPALVDCLSPEFANYVLEQAIDKDFKRSVVIEKGGNIARESRTNSSWAIPKGELDKFLHLCVNESLMNWTAQVMQNAPKGLILNELALPGGCYSSRREYQFQLLRYEAGQEYKWHWDAAHTLDRTERDRQYSVVVYLNDDFEGGETQVWNDIIKPQKGKALVFPSHWTYPHRALPVTKGTKYALVTWYYFD